MDWEVIWQPILSTSGLGPSQLRSVEVASVERQGADSTFIGIKSRLVFFAGKHNSVSNKGVPVNLDLSQLSTFPFHCVVSDLTSWTEGVGVLSALGTKNYIALCAHTEKAVKRFACIRSRNHAFLLRVRIIIRYTPNSCCFFCFPFYLNLPVRLLSVVSPLLLP